MTGDHRLKLIEECLIEHAADAVDWNSDMMRQNLSHPVNRRFLAFQTAISCRIDVKDLELDMYRA